MVVVGGLTDGERVENGVFFRKLLGGSGFHSGGSDKMVAGLPKMPAGLAESLAGTA